MLTRGWGASPTALAVEPLDGGTETTVLLQHAGP